MATVLNLAGVEQLLLIYGKRHLEDAVSIPRLAFVTQIFYRRCSRCSRLIQRDF